MQTIFRNELRALTDGFRYPASVILLIALMVGSALVYSARYRTEVREFESALADYEAQLEGVTIDQAVSMYHPAVKAPWKLAFLADGHQLTAPNLYQQALSAWIEPVLTRTFTGNFRLQGPEAVDWMLLVQVVLSLVAFVLAYDSICGERRTGTLKLLLSYPISRWQVLAGKFLANWLCLGAAFVLGAALALGLLVSYGGLRFDGSQLLKIAVVGVLILWALAFFLLMAFLVSILARDSFSSLATLALLWIVAVEFVPAGGTLLARSLEPIPTPQKVAQLIEGVRQKVEEEFRGPGSWRGRRWAAGDDFVQERQAGRIQNRRFAGQEKIRRQVLLLEQKQAELAWKLSYVSPIALIRHVGEEIAGSGVDRNLAFLEQSWRFREDLSQRIAQLDSRDPESPHLLFFSSYMSERPLDPDEVLRFSFEERTVRQGLGSARAGLLILALETFLLIAACLIFLARYDLH